MTRETEDLRGDEEKAFEEGFAGDDSAPAERPEADDPPLLGDEDDAGGEDGEHAGPDTDGEDDGAGREPPPATPEPDPWEGVSEPVRKHFESLGQRLDAFTHETRSDLGRLRHLQGVVNRLDTQLAARQDAAARGGDAPTAAEIAAASQDADEYAALKEEFPEWGAAMDAQIKRWKDDVLAQVPRVDQDALRQDLRAELYEELRDELRMEMRHPDWKAVANSGEFQTWLYEGGPTLEERQQHQSLEQSDPARAAVYMNELVRRYPQWWADRGALAESPRAEDVADLLDKYKGRAAAPAPASDGGAGTDEDPPAAPAPGAAPEPSAPSRGRNERRLAAAVAPDTGGGTTRRAMTEDEAFEAGFNEA